MTKGSDESVTSSTALQNDDALFFTAVSGAVYEISAVIIYASPIGGATPNIKIGFGEDNSTLRGSMVGNGLTTAGAPAVNATATDNTQGRAWGTGTANRVVQEYGEHVGAGGTFRLLWAQNTSDVNAVTVRTGSVLRYRRII